MTKIVLKYQTKDASQMFIGTNLTVSGWGTLAFKGLRIPKLKAAQVTGLSNLECQDVYGRNVITPRMICAASKNFSDDACQGDSGGNFYLKRENGRLELSYNVCLDQLFCAL